MLMNSELTAVTRPRISSGVSSCISVTRMTTLMASAPPMIASAAHASQNDPDNANTMVATPNTATAANSMRPTLRENDQRVSMTVTSSAPIAGAARSMPSPDGPGVEHVLGEDRQQRGCAAEEHGEQVHGR